MRFETARCVFVSCSHTSNRKIIVYSDVKVNRKFQLIVCDSQVVVGNRILIKGYLNHTVNITGQHLVPVDVFL